jgi:hypothetical protein
MNGRRTLMCAGMPALMLLVQPLPVGFAHNPSLSQETPGHKDLTSTRPRAAGGCWLASRHSPGIPGYPDINNTGNKPFGRWARSSATR